IGTPPHRCARPPSYFPLRLQLHHQSANRRTEDAPRPPCETFAGESTVLHATCPVAFKRTALSDKRAAGGSAVRSINQLSLSARQRKSCSRRGLEGELPRPDERVVRECAATAVRRRGCRARPPQQ